MLIVIYTNAPARGATFLRRNCRKSAKVSIHAPARGATVYGFIYLFFCVCNDFFAKYKKFLFPILRILYFFLRNLLNINMCEKSGFFCTLMIRFILSSRIQSYRFRFYIWHQRYFMYYCQLNITLHCRVAAL